MATNLEKAKRLLNDDFDGVMNHHNIAHEAVELAALPDWKYPSKGQYPDNDRRVICQLMTGGISPKLIGQAVSFYRKEINKFNCEFDWTFVVAWHELIIYNEQ